MQKNTHAADGQAVIDHIHGIFQAFLRQDRQALRHMHSQDWVGFMGPSTGIERGIDAYMANAEKSLQHFKGTSYDLLDTEVQMFGDLALVFYVARYHYMQDDGTTHFIPLRSIDIYQRRNGEWIQTGSHITVIPAGGAWGEDEKVAPSNA